MKKTKIIILIIMMLLTFTIYFFPKVKADSGFDTSYDSGGSWSSSSGGWDYDSGSSGGGEPSKKGTIVLTIITIGLTTYLTYYIIKDIKAGGSFIIGKRIIKTDSNNKIIITKRQFDKKVNTVNQVTPIDDNTLKKYIPNINKEQFLTDRFNDYVKIQNDWMNFNYNGLRENLTDELYNEYEMQLETLKINNQQNIMKDYTLKDKEITEIKEENGIIEITVELLVSLIDYIEKNGKVVRGNPNRTITHHYKLIFIKRKDYSNDRCPNCDAPISENGSQKCDYCGSIINRVGNKWILSKKESKKQW